MKQECTPYSLTATYTKRQHFIYVRNVVVTNPGNGRCMVTCAMIDTGSRYSSITAAVVRRLDLSPAGTQTTIGITSTKEVNTYCAHLAFKGTAMRFAVQCGTCSEITPSVGAIIGMDVLSLCNLRLSNDGASTVLHISLAAHT